ncbi:adenylate/guanylate cyclase domain-containing protein [Thiocystis violacea]|uniref:adenylate/guanylate cyclase domain-containing protein n=1 Tax=Thiocystis violacea TaxID=13725 RepID=UPI001F5B280A|nr:adenylate/guanylate cyclase domain-containing protein [Thiocystis violacea]
MQHKDKQLLLAGVTGAIEEVYGKAAPSRLEAALSERLTPQLDAFMQKSHPIVGTTATILIADLRGFSALMESLPAIQMADLLNRFFSLMSQVIERHGGVIDKFMGDSVMALFGAPVRRSAAPTTSCAPSTARSRCSRPWRTSTATARRAASPGSMRASR